MAWAYNADCGEVYGVHSSVQDVDDDDKEYA